MNTQDLQKELVWMETEIRNLKSPQGAITTVNGYLAQIDDPTTKVKITYDSGKNDIITKVYVIGDALTDTLLTTPDENEQYILSDVGVPGSVGGYRIVSTRPILSVENVA